VRSREPLWHEDERRAVEAVTLAEPETEPVMPGPSFWPLWVGFGVALTWALVMTGIWWVPLLGFVFTVVGVYGWAFEDPFRNAHGHTDPPAGTPDPQSPMTNGHETHG
jgi:hypothetical protein